MNMIKLNYLKKRLWIFVIGGFFLACDDESEVTIIDTSMPQGTFEVSATGTIVEQNETGTTGTVSMGTDSEGTRFLKFDNDFMTNLGTGTVTVNLSTSMEYSPDLGAGNPDLLIIGPVRNNGEQYFKLDPAPDSKFDHVIFWCETAEIPFGYAALQ